MIMISQGTRAIIFSVICIFSLEPVFGQSKVDFDQVRLMREKVVTFSATVYGIKISKNKKEVILSVGDDSTKSLIDVLLKLSDSFSHSDLVPGLVFDITGKVTVSDKSRIVVISDKLPKLSGDYIDDTTKLPVFN